MAKNKDLTVKWNLNPTVAAAANAAAANAANNNPIAVNPTGVTQGRYGTYSVGTIPVYNSKYDNAAVKALKQYAGMRKYTSPVQKPLNQYTNLVANPGEFDDKWASYIDKYAGLLDKEYDPNSDPNYLAYKNQYLAGGQKAMQDTLAQAAALTGGYGSSYGQSAAQQTYGEYTAALANKIPELAQAAQDMYLGKLNAYSGLRSQDWGMYNDDRNYNQNALSSLIGLNNMYYDQFNGTRNAQYNIVEALSNLANRDYERGKAEYGMWQNAVDALTPKSSGGGGGRSSGGSGGRKSSSKNDYDLVTELQYANKHGATVGQMLDYAKEELANGAEVVIPGTKTALPQGAGAEYVRSQLQNLLNQKKSYK